MSDRTEQSERSFPMYHRGVQSGNTKKGEPTGEVERIRTVYHLRHDRPQHYLQICESVQEPTKRAILTAIADTQPTEYQHIESYTNVSRRTIRTHITDLEGSNIITKTVDAIMTVSFADEQTALLVEDALAMFYASV